MFTGLSRDIATLLDKEIALYQRYGEILKEERVAVVQSKNELIADLALKRDAIVEQMSACQDARLKLIRSVQGLPLEGSRKEKFEPLPTLTKVIELHCPKPDRTVLLQKTNLLRALVIATRRQNSEFDQILSFALSMIGGLASIFWSATQSVVRSYTSGGGIKESTHSTKGKAATLLKQA